MNGVREYGDGGDGDGGRDGRWFTIDCDECVMQGTEVCDDCVVTFLCGREPGEAVVVDVQEARAMRLLAGAGLVPGLRHVRRSG